MDSPLSSLLFFVHLLCSGYFKKFKYKIKFNSKHLKIPFSQFPESNIFPSHTKDIIRNKKYVFLLHAYTKKKQKKFLLFSSTVIGLSTFPIYVLIWQSKEKVRLYNTSKKITKWPQHTFFKMFFILKARHNFSYYISHKFITNGYLPFIQQIFMEYPLHSKYCSYC